MAINLKKTENRNFHFLHIFGDIEPVFDPELYTWEELIARAKQTRIERPADGLYWYRPVASGPVKIQNFTVDLNEGDGSDPDEVDLSNAILLLDSARGVYIPRDFWAMWAHLNPVILPDMTQDKIFEVSEVLDAGPDHVDYWETWEDVLNTRWNDVNDTYYYLNHDEDLWLIPYPQQP